MNSNLELMTTKEMVDEYVDANWSYYKTWLAEYIGYAGGLDWDTDETRYEFCKDSGLEFS